MWVARPPPSRSSPPPRPPERPWAAPLRRLVPRTAPVFLIAGPFPRSPRPVCDARGSPPSVFEGPPLVVASGGCAGLAPSPRDFEIIAPDPETTSTENGPFARALEPSGPDLPFSLLRPDKSAHCKPGLRDVSFLFWGDGGWAPASPFGRPARPAFARFLFPPPSCEAVTKRKNWPLVQPAVPPPPFIFLSPNSGGNAGFFLPPVGNRPIDDGWVPLPRSRCWSPPKQAKCPPLPTLCPPRRWTAVT